jgi:ferritin
MPNDGITQAPELPKGDRIMLPAKMEDAFNKHLNAEMYSAYLYFSMASCFEAQNLSGMASWMKQQAQEEAQHAMKFYDFIQQRGGKVVLGQIDAPKAEWDTPLAAFEDAYKHECVISAKINNLVDLAEAEKDHASNAFLQWFVTEQVEEEASVLTVVEKLRLAGSQTGALFMLDRELGMRARQGG